MPNDNSSDGSGLDRRSVLKSAAITGVAGAGLTGTVAGEDDDDEEDAEGDFYEVAVWIPHDLIRRCEAEYGDPWRAQKRAKTYIEGAFARTRHSVEVMTPKIPVPNRNHTNYRVKKKAICNHHKYPDNGTDFDGWLLNPAWLRDWLESDCVPWESAAHSNIMITDGHNRGGGLAFGSGRYATAATGRFVAKLPEEYQPYGYNYESDAIQAMWVTLHEMGHNLLQNGIDNDNDGTGHHDTGEIWERREGPTMTPMGLGGEVDPDGITTNNCGEQFDKSKWNGGRELTYGECAQGLFKPGFKSDDDGGRGRGPPNDKGRGPPDNVVDLEGAPTTDVESAPEVVLEEYGD